MADDWHAPTQRAANYVVTAANWNEVMDDLDALKSVVMGDSQATEEVIHSHRGGAYASMPTPGNAGRTYLATDMGLWFVDNGTYWYPDRPILSLCDAMRDDFHRLPTQEDGTGDAQGARWDMWIDAAGPTVELHGSHGNSCLHIQLPNTTDEGALFSHEEYWALDAGACPCWLETYMFLDNTDMYAQWGWIDSFPGASARPANGIFFELNTAVNDHWWAVTGVGSSYTATDTGVQASGSTFQRLVIVAESTSSIKFYIDNLAVAEATHATDIPAGDSFHLVFGADAGGGSKDLIADYVQSFFPRLPALS